MGMCEHISHDENKIQFKTVLGPRPVEQIDTYLQNIMGHRNVHMVYR